MKGSNFVSAVEPIPARPAPTADNVAAKWRDNLGAWIGISTMLTGAYSLLRIGLANANLVPLPSAQGAAWALVVFVIIGGIAFGWLMAWRSSLDERERQGEIDAMRDAISMLEAEKLELEAEISDAEIRYTNIKLQYEQVTEDLASVRNSLHRAMNQSNRFVVPVEKAEPAEEKNAKFLLGIAYRDRWRGRDYIVETYAGWTPTMWTEARNLLEHAGIIRTINKQVELLKPDYDSAIVALSAHCHPDGS